MSFSTNAEFTRAGALSRVGNLLSTSDMECLGRSHVAIFGLGGVGSYAAMALARSGVGRLTLVDGDTVAVSNCNRQLMAYEDTLGLPKAEALARELRRMMPGLALETVPAFADEAAIRAWPLDDYDYVLDAIDTVSCKIALALRAKELDVPFLAAMGAGNKLDPTRLKVADLAKTSVCPLARVMRRELAHRGLEHVKVVYSDEPPMTPRNPELRGSGRPSPGSLVMVPAAMGLVMASTVIQDLIRIEGGESCKYL